MCHRHAVSWRHLGVLIGKHRNKTWTNGNIVWCSPTWAVSDVSSSGLNDRCKEKMRGRLFFRNCLSQRWVITTNDHRWSGLHNIYFSQFRRLNDPRSRGWQNWHLVRTHFLDCRQPSSPLPSHGKEQGGASSLWTLIRTLIPFMRTPPWRPHLTLITSQRPHLLIPSYSTYNWGVGEGTNVLVHNRNPRNQWERRRRH